MLVLTRHCGEQLVIADDILVTVVAIEGNRIRLGIEAPRSVRIDRKEIHNRLNAEWRAKAPPVEAEKIQTGSPIG